MTAKQPSGRLHYSNPRTTLALTRMSLKMQLVRPFDTVLLWQRNEVLTNVVNRSCQNLSLDSNDPDPRVRLRRLEHQLVGPS